MTLLKVENLSVTFPSADGFVKAVDNVSFEIEKGETLAIVGESGSGKTVTNLALMNLLSKKTTSVSGTAIFNNNSQQTNLIDLSEVEAQSIRGRNIAMIFQDPMSSLHPYFSIGDQLIEAHQAHNEVSRDVSKARAIELLELVGIADANTRLNSYPHQFSGGMRQRVLIAMGLINDPELLIADEPTTALDVTVQAQILRLLKSLQKELKMAIILITHDLGVVAGAADRVNVMYAGKIVESADVNDLYESPFAPYTHGLLASIPRPDVNRKKRLQAINGQPPSLLALPAGCAFAPRCDFASRVPGGRDWCASHAPALTLRAPRHWARCHLMGDSL